MKEYKLMKNINGMNRFNYMNHTKDAEFKEIDDAFESLEFESQKDKIIIFKLAAVKIFILYITFCETLVECMQKFKIMADCIIRFQRTKDCRLFFMMFVYTIQHANIILI